MDSTAALDWRPLTLADADAFAAFIEEVEAVDQYGWHFDAEFLRRWLDDPTIDLERGTVAAFDGGRLVASGVLVARTEADPTHGMRYEGSVHPEYRGRGVGGALMQWIERSAVPVHRLYFPDRPLEVLAGFKDTDQAAAALFTQYGFKPVRYFHTMKHGLAPDALPPVRVPEGFTIAPYRPELDEQVRLAKNEAFRDHWGVTPTPPDMWRSRFVGPEFVPELSPLALDAQTGAITGLIITHLYKAMTEATGERDAHLNNVATLRPARGRGVASALLATMLAAARERGFDTASLDVDSENPTGALGLYEKAGFTVVDTWIYYRRDFGVA